MSDKQSAMSDRRRASTDSPPRSWRHAGCGARGSCWSVPTRSRRATFSWPQAST